MGMCHSSGDLHHATGPGCTQPLLLQLCFNLSKAGLLCSSSTSTVFSLCCLGVRICLQHCGPVVLAFHAHALLPCVLVALEPP